MNKAMFSLVVCERDGRYFSLRFFTNDTTRSSLLEGAKEIFTVSGSDLSALEEEAREKARELNLVAVTNLLD